MKDLLGKDFVLLLAWFFVSFILLWFFSGSCLSLFVEPSQVSNTCVSVNSLNFLTNIPIIGWFLPLAPWTSFFYWFVPIAGFVLSIFVMRSWNNYFGTKEAYSIFFLIIMIFFLLSGMFLTIFWYYFNVTSPVSEGIQYGLHFCLDNNPQTCNSSVSTLNQEYIAQYQREGGQIVHQLIPIDFFGELRKNILFSFIVGAILAWVPFFVNQTFFNKD